MRIQYFVVAFAITSGIAQEHPYSNAWSYYTTAVTSDGQFSATTVAGTGGTATHTMSQIAVFVQSPSGRTASAFNYPGGTQGRATTYLPLCGGGICEDGQFFVSTVNTTELCGQTGQTLVLPVQSGNSVTPQWIRWTGSSFNPQQVERSQGSSTYTATAQKSTNCPGATASFGAAGPPGMSISFTPSQPPMQALVWNGTIGSGVWTFRTNLGNTVSGVVTGGAGFEETPCTVIGGQFGTSATVTVK
jgi:hypothetical protein